MTLSYVEDLNFNQELKVELDDLDSITNYYQAIVGIAHSNLNSLEDLDRPGTYNVPGWRENRPWSYPMLLSATKSTYGNLAEFAVMISKYHQQVCNGGHLQYWDNGYASKKNNEDIYIHHQLRSYYDYFLDEVKDFLNLSEEDYKLLLEVDTIMSRFQQQLELESGQTCTIVSDEYGELYEYSKEDNRNYPEPTRWCQEHWNYLDDHYYKIKDKFIEILEDYFREKLELS